MNIKNKLKINSLSIKRINFILFFLMFCWILLFIFLHDNNMDLLFILTYIFIFCFFLFFNYLYNRELEETKKLIKEFIKDNKNDLLIKSTIYTENKENNNLFNNLIVNKNIIKKDYIDLEKVLFTFTSEYFLDQVSEKGRDRVDLWVSIEKNIHVMFLDIIGFTTITEKLRPERALLLLNIYFDWIVEIIKKNHWFIDKFLWDWILAVFTEKDADNSIKASIEIQKFISNFRISEIWRNISVWIWINSWWVIMWTIWSKDRMEVTIIWDTVNTASRIEWLTRRFKDKVIISQETFKLIKNKNLFNIKDLWEKVLKWKKIKKRIYWVESIINLDI